MHFSHKKHVRAPSQKFLHVKFYWPNSFYFFVFEGGPILLQYHFLKVDPPKCGGCPACGSDGGMLTLARTRVCVANKMTKKKMMMMIMRVPTI